MEAILITFTLVPRINEIGGGHIGNAVPPIWFEEARVPFLDHATQLTSTTDALSWVVRHATYDYERELFYRGDVEIRSRVVKIGTTSLTLYQEAWQNGQRAVTATTTVVLFNATTRNKMAATEATRRHLETLMK